MDFPEHVVDDLQKRLSRAEGQVRAVRRMLEDGRDCREVVTQLSAANSALEQAGFRLIAAGLEYCVSDPEGAAAEGLDIDEVQKMFTRIA